MKLHFLLEGGRGHEALELCDAHFLHIHELHVAGDHRHDGIDGVVRVFEAAQDGLGDFGPHRIVAVEADAPGIGIDGPARWLGDVVQQDGQAEFEWRIGCEHLEHDAGMREDIALGVPFGWLIAADHRQDFRHEMADQAGIHEVLESGASAGREQDFGKFVTDALGRDPVEQMGTLLECGIGFRFDGEAQGAGEAHGPQQT